MTITVQSIHIYPVKSFRGIDLPRARLTPLGLAHDRAWLAIDGQDQFLSQRRLPAMAQITTRLEGDQLILEREGLAPCPVPNDADEIVEAGETRVTEVWENRCEVVDTGAAVAQWLGKALGQDDVRLVRMAPAFARPQPRPDRYGEGTTTLFADTAPFLVANVGSLERLNETLVAQEDAPVPMDRFRANIVVDGLEPFAEHGVATLEGPGYRLGLRYARERCVMTTMDQQTGDKHPRGEPFQTLRRINPMPGNPKGPAFAELAVLEHGADAWIQVGDPLTVNWR